MALKGLTNWRTWACFGLMAGLYSTLLLPSLSRKEIQDVYTRDKKYIGKTKLLINAHSEPLDYDDWLQKKEYKVQVFDPK